jgi:hypothetical protein
MGPKLHTDGTLSALREHAIQNSKKMCVDLSPIKTYNCEWGPNLIPRQRLRNMPPKLYTDGTLAQYALPEHKIPSSSRREGLWNLDQQCCYLSPIRK